MGGIKLFPVTPRSSLSPSQRHRKREICIHSANFDGDFLARGRPLNQIGLQMRRIQDFRVVHGQDDVVLLNAGFFRRVGHLLYGHAPLGPVLHRGHVNPQFGERERLACEGRAHNSLGENSRNGEGHAAAMGLRLVFFCLDNGVHDPDDVPLDIE